MCFQIHVGYLPKNKDGLCTLRIPILSRWSCSLQYTQKGEMTLAAPACIDLCRFLCSPVRELGGAELTSSVSFSNAGDLGRRELFSACFLCYTQLSCKICIENGFNKSYWLKAGVSQWNWENLSAVCPGKCSITT